MPWTLCCLSILGVTSPCVHCLLIKLVWYRGRRPGLLVGTGWEPMYASCKAPTGRWGLCKLGSRLWLGGPACRAKKKKAEVSRLTRASSFFFFARQQTACHKANTQSNAPINTASYYNAPINNTPVGSSCCAAMLQSTLVSLARSSAAHSRWSCRQHLVL